MLRDRFAMKKNTIAILLFILSQAVYPQIRRSMLVDMKKGHERVGQADVPEKHRHHAAPLPDTVYCTSIKKQYGWYAPLKMITEETARHHGIVYRFTNRNAKGRWCKMESINGRGDFVSSGLSPYILNIYTSESDISADTKWVEKLKTTCIFELIPDPSGINLIQERALDKDGNIVYLFSRTPIGRDAYGNEQYVGSYKDCYGLPAEMRKDPGYTYGTLVMITEDKWGNDRVIEYMDAAGITKPNSYGVSAECFVYDAEGRILRKELRDGKGRLAADNRGNCGLEFTWTGYDITSVTCMDTEWKPMKMTSSPFSAGGEGVVRINSRYDMYGRQSELYFTSADGLNPDSNASGIHKIAYSYNDYGDITDIRFYDSNGELVNNSHSGIAVIKKEYDDAGRITEQLNLDKDENPCVTVLYPSRKRYGYGAAGEIVLSEEYSSCTGQEELVYKYEKTDSCIYEMLGDGTYEIDMFDAKGRTVSVAYYEKDGSPRTQLSGWFKNIISYNDSQGKTVVTGMYFDSDGKPVNVGDKGAKRIKETDSLTYTSKNYIYNKDGAMIECVATVFDTTFTKVKSLYDINCYGIPSRSGGYRGARWHRADAIYSCKDELSSFTGRDEFNEKDYIDVTSEQLYYYQRIGANGRSKYYDENNDVIEDFKMLRNELPKVMSVEVTDSIAYSLGLKDNDVVLIYGEYSADFAETPTLNEIMAKWSLYSVLTTEKEKKMVVFRIDPLTLDYRLVEISGLKGSYDKQGFIAHIRYLTKVQKERIIKAIDENVKSDKPLVSWSDFDKGNKYAGDKPVIIAYPDMCRNIRYLSFQQKIPVPAILLASSVESKGLIWHNGMELDAFSDILASRKLKSSVYVDASYSFTTDMDNIITITQRKEPLYTDWFYCYVNSNVYRQILKATKSAYRQNRQSGK